MQESLEEAVEHPGEVVIDMRACAFIDSMGIAVIAGAAARLREEGRHLVLRGVGGRALRTLTIAGLASGPAVTIEPQEPPSKDS
jgi:anti-anti-sigma factor